jgi:SRSO17 transposase
MSQTNESTPAPTEQEVSAIQGWATYLTDVEPRWGPYVARAESRQRAMIDLDGLLRPAERKHRWPLADICGEPTPYGVQYVLGRAGWDADAVRDARRPSVIPHLGDPTGVLVLDETGWVKQGCHSAGVARPDTGTVGQVENGPIGVCLGDAGQLGHALVDRELDGPTEWANDCERCRQAGIPADRPVATTPPLACQMLARAFAAGVPAPWGTGDRVYGADRHLRVWLEARPQADGLAVSGQE